MKPTTILTSVSALLLTTTIAASQAIAQSYDGWVFIAEQMDGLKFHIHPDRIQRGSTPRFLLREDATNSYNEDYQFGIRDVTATIDCNNKNKGFRYIQATVYDINGNQRQISLREQHEIYSGSALGVIWEAVCSL